jgi:hypothetical protein
VVAQPEQQWIPADRYAPSGEAGGTVDGTARRNGFPEFSALRGRHSSLV